jgi:hypothetical protein
MKTSFKKAFTLFKYSAILFTFVFWIYALIDDWVLITTHDKNFELIGVYLLWYLIYFLAFALYYWIITSAILLLYHKVIKRD